MPSAKEIKSRIASIKDTQKITNAMYLISSTKLRTNWNTASRSATRPFRSKRANGIAFWPATGESELPSYRHFRAWKAG